MSSLRVLEVITALVFMFYAAALISSGLVEWLANIVKKRAKYLLRGMHKLLQGTKAQDELGSWKPTLVASGSTGAERRLYRGALKPAGPRAVSEAAPGPAVELDPTVATIMSSPLVRAFAQSDASGTITRLPSYLSSEVFTDTLLSLLGLARTSSAADMEKAIDRLVDGDLKEALRALLKAHEGDANEFGKSIERWYDHAMDRVSGAYKRWSRRWLIVIGLLIAVGMHLDAVGLATNLWSDETSRAALVKAIDDAPECNGETDAEKKAACIDDVVEALGAEGPPIGPQAWGKLPEDPEQWMLLVLGLLLTGSAAALGATFWFDALGQLNSLRNAGPRPPKAAS